ncbi:DUF6894 family protein [Methylobacterium sp. CM6257]
MSPRFFFDVLRGEETMPDGLGAEAANLNEALTEARRVISEMADEVAEANPGQPLTLIVRNSAGWVLARLPIKR